MNITPNHTKREEMYQILTNINVDITHIKEKHKVSHKHRDRMDEDQTLKTENLWAANKNNIWTLQFLLNADL